ncbi:MAG: hypothetical protein A2V66_10240 [Ignavibacteria bacterium RBG_13_36_8]|nr:MAG: hypothetical protein A2V66_10240 [Ignavibacteria bacterium RBG_13_36_8]
MEFITRLEEMLLIAIWKLKEEAYGVSINKQVSKLSDKNYTIGSLYFSLDQLYRKGLIDKSHGEPTPERGGRRKIYYSLTPEGEKALEAVRSLHAKLWGGVPDSINWSE